MDKLIKIWRKSNRWHLTLFAFVIAESRIFSGGRLGFICNDPSLSHAFFGDTISWKWLLAVTAFLPFVVMLIVERMYHNTTSKKARRRALYWYREYGYGLLLNLTVVQVLKLVVGAPRPHFFDTCRPSEADTCEASEFVTSYTCTKAHWISQSDKSFPSGHTSLAIHAAFFIMWYLHRRVSAVCLRVSRVVHCVQCACATAALYCALSRVTDRRHHLTDVIGGTVIAVPILVYTIFYLCNNFERPSSPKPENQTLIRQDGYIDKQTIDGATDSTAILEKKNTSNQPAST